VAATVAPVLEGLDEVPEVGGAPAPPPADFAGAPPPADFAGAPPPADFAGAEELRLKPNAAGWPRTTVGGALWPFLEVAEWTT
jgi:hypothetical protein